MINRLGGLYNQATRWGIWDINYKSPTFVASAGLGGGHCPMIPEPVCVAMRGRMYRGEPQHYEARDDGKTNVLTRVEKDNYVAEPVPYKEKND